MLRFSAETQQSKVRKQIDALLQNLQPGDKLPSEPQLAKQLGVSRTTIRDVMGQLVTEGFVIRRQGSGTFVTYPPLEPDESLLHFIDFPTLIQKQGHVPAFHQLGFVLQEAGDFFAQRFQIAPTDQVITRRCLYMADSHFCVLAEDSFPAALLTSGQHNTLLQSQNIDLRLFLFTVTGRTTYQDETTISVALPSDYPFLYSLLHGQNTPLLFMSSICLDKQNRPLTSSQIYSDTTYIKFQLNRRIL